jgi:hypothetical protein
VAEYFGAVCVNVLRDLLIPVSACLLAASCAVGLDRDRCISEYAQRGGTEQIVRWGYQLCSVATDESRSGEERARAVCAVKKIPQTPTELAFRQVIAECRSK